MGGLRLARAGNGPLFNPDVEVLRCCTPCCTGCILSSFEFAAAALSRLVFVLARVGVCYTPAALCLHPPHTVYHTPRILISCLPCLVLAPSLFIHQNGGNIANCATDPRPSDTVWHWGYCHDGDVVMEPLLSVLNCEVGCRITQGPLCMLDTATNQQFDVTFTTWGSGQGTCPGAYRYEISVYPPNSVCVMQPYFLQLQ